MNFFKDNYTIEKTISFKPNLEQKFLLEFTGKDFPAEEAAMVWPKVIDHKWFISERLNRDVGLRVAAVDYIHNIHQSSGHQKKDGLIKTAGKFIRTVLSLEGPPPVTKKYTY